MQRTGKSGRPQSLSKSPGSVRARAQACRAGAEMPLGYRRGSGPIRFPGRHKMNCPAGAGEGLRGRCVGENTSRPVSVGAARHRRTASARSRPQLLQTSGKRMQDGPGSTSCEKSPGPSCEGAFSRTCALKRPDSDFSPSSSDDELCAALFARKSGSAAFPGAPEGCCHMVSTRWRMVAISARVR